MRALSFRLFLPFCPGYRFSFPSQTNREEFHGTKTEVQSHVIPSSLCPFYVFFTFANRFAHKGSPPPPPPCFFAVTPFASFSRVFVRLIQLTLPRTDASELVLHKHKREISRYCTTELSSQAGGHTTHIKLFFSSQPTSSSIMCNTEATSRG